MGVSDAIEAAGEAGWLDTVDEALTAPADRLQSLGDDTVNALHGAWLGHPLHPAVTDVPVGAWTAAAWMDTVDAVSGEDRYAAGADAAIAVGLAGAVAAAVTGLQDWNRHTGGRSRRLGALHGLLNGVATLLYGGSLAARKRGERSTGRWLAAAGYGLVLASSAIGGHLVFERRVGVNRAPKVEKTGPDDWAAAIPVDMLGEGEPKAVQVGKLKVVLVRRWGRIHCLADRCAHLGGPLSEGKLEGDGIVCPWHGSCFHLEDGRVLRGPSAYRQPHLQTRVRRGWIEVRTERT